MKQNQHTKARSYSLILFLLFVFAGLLFLYKGVFSKVTLKRYNGIVLSSSNIQVFGRYSNDEKRAHSILLIEVQGLNKILGIYAGSVAQADQLSKELGLISGTEYSFLVDTTIVSPVDVYPGVRTIKYGDEVVYQDTSISSQTFFGWLFLCAGLATGLYYYSLQKKKLES